MDIEVAAEPIDLNQPPVEQDDSLAAHEAQFGEPKPQAPDAPPQQEPERPRHRAQSQRAKASDVEDIAAFTKRLREAEEAIPIERKDGESDRVYQLRRRAEIAELAKTYKTQPPPKTEPIAAVPPPRAAVPPPATGGFPEAEPTIEQFANAPDPYLALTRAVAAYDRRKEAWEAQQASAKRDHDAATQASYDRDRKAIAAHQARMTEAMKQPDFQAVTAPILNRNMPTALLKAVVTADNSPQLVYALAKDPDLLDDLIVASHGKSEEDDELVATLQRRLLKRAQAGTTGSAAVAPPIKTTPRPPNPVRTGPIASGDDLPGDESSLAEHERAFGHRRRRR